MLVSFDSMPDSARLWIYQAERPLSDQEKESMLGHTSEFLKAWTAHGNDLFAACEIQYDQFLIISLDESKSQASGCSIDASVHYIQELEKAFNLTLLNNNKVAFLVDEKIELVPVNGLKALVANEKVTSETKVFNNTIKTLGDFRDKWLVESGSTWINRYFN